MPGFELVDHLETNAVNKVLDTGVFFRHGFDHLRKQFAVEDFESDFSQYIGKKYALAVSSGTAALRVALAALNYPQDSEIITTNFTFVATIEAIVEARCRPVAVDVNEMLTIDPDAVRRAITPKTKAIIAVHMLGSPCDMVQLKNICVEYGIDLIEDTAWGLGGSFHHSKLGSLSTIGTFSFDHAKALTTGEGGMLVTDDEELYLKAKAWHDHGHENNPDVARWEDTRSSSGFNFRMTEIQGAIGRVQLSKLDLLIQKQSQFASDVTNILQSKKNKVKSEHPLGTPSYDAILVDCGSPQNARFIRNALVERNFGSKILPEAISWHFAGDFKHIPELEVNFDVGKARAYLGCFIALPSFYNTPENYLNVIDEVF